MKLSQTAHPLPPRFARLGRLFRAVSPSVMASPVRAVFPGSRRPHYTTEMPLSERNSDKIFMKRLEARRVAASQKAKETAANDVTVFEPRAAS